LHDAPSHAKRQQNRIQTLQFSATFFHTSKQSMRTSMARRSFRFQAFSFFLRRLVSDVDNDPGDQKIRTKNRMPLSRQEGLWQYQNLQVAVSDLMSSDQINLNLCMLSDGVTSPFILPGWIFSHLRTLI